MTDNEVNIPLLRKAVEWAEAEAVKPDAEGQWVQEAWGLTPESDLYQAKGLTCGTSYCIAGYVCFVSGEDLIVGEEGNNYMLREVGDGTPIADRAAELLGLKDNQDTTFGLFAASNTIEQVRSIAEQIAGERL